MDGLKIIREMSRSGLEETISIVIQRENLVRALRSQLVDSILYRIENVVVSEFLERYKDEVIERIDKEAIASAATETIIKMLSRGGEEKKQNKDNIKKASQ